MFSLISAVLCNDAQSSEQQGSQYRDEEILRHVIEYGIERSQESDTEIRQALERLTKEVNLSEKQKVFLQFYLAKMRQQGIGESLIGNKFAKIKDKSKKDTSFIKAEKSFRDLINNPHLPEDLRAQVLFYVAEMNFKGQNATSYKNYKQVIGALEPLNLLAGHNPDLLPQSMYDQAMFMLVDSYQHTTPLAKAKIIRNIYEQCENKKSILYWTKDQQIKAKLNLANMYYEGRGGEKRRDLSTQLYEQLVEMLSTYNSLASYRVGDIKTKIAYAYYYGKGVTKDRSKAKNILQEILSKRMGGEWEKKVKYLRGRIYFEEAEYKNAREIFERSFFKELKGNVVISLHCIIQEELLLNDSYYQLEKQIDLMKNLQEQLKLEIEQELKRNQKKGVKEGHEEQLWQEMQEESKHIEEKKIELEKLSLEYEKILESRRDLLEALRKKEPLKSLYNLFDILENSKTLIEVFDALMSAEKSNIHAEVSKVNVFEREDGGKLLAFKISQTKKLDMFFKLAMMYRQNYASAEERQAAQFIFKRLSKLKKLKPEMRSVVDYFITEARFYENHDPKDKEQLEQLSKGLFGNALVSNEMRARIKLNLALLNSQSKEKEDHAKVHTLMESLLTDKTLSPSLQTEVKLYHIRMKLKNIGGSIETSEALKTLYMIKDDSNTCLKFRNQSKFLIAMLKCHLKDKASIAEIRQYFEELVKDDNFDDIPRKVQASFKLAYMLQHAAGGERNYAWAYRLYLVVANSQQATQGIQAQALFNAAYMLYTAQGFERPEFKYARKNFEELENNQNLSPRELSLTRFLLAKMKFLGLGGVQDLVGAQKRFEYLVQDKNLSAVEKNTAYLYLAMSLYKNSADVEALEKAESVLKRIKDDEKMDPKFRLKARYCLEEIAYNYKRKDMKDIYSSLQQIKKELDSIQTQHSVCDNEVNDLLSKMEYLGHGTQQLPLADRTGFLSFKNDREYSYIRNQLLALHAINDEEKVSKIIDLMQVLHSSRQNEGLLELSEIIATMMQLQGDVFEHFKELLMIVSPNKNWTLTVNNLLLKHLRLNKDIDFESLKAVFNTLIEHRIVFPLLKPHMYSKFKHVFSLIAELDNEELQEILGNINKRKWAINGNIDFTILAAYVELYKEHGKETCLKWLGQIDDITEGLAPKYGDHIVRLLTRVHKSNVDNILTYCQMYLMKESIENNNFIHLFTELNKILPENHNFDDGFLERCRRCLIGEDRELAAAALNFLKTFKQDLGLTEENDVMQRACTVQIELQKKDDSAYSLHAQLKQKKTVDTEWHRLAAFDIEGDHLSFNHQGLKDFSYGFQVDYESAPDVKSNDFITLLDDFKEKMEADEKIRIQAHSIAEETNQDITIDELIANAQSDRSYFNLTLNSPKDRYTGPLKCVIGHLMRAPDEVKWRDVARFLSAARFCNVGKDGAIQDFYNGLPATNRMKLIANHHTENGTEPKWSFDKCDKLHKPAWEEFHSIIMNFASAQFSSEGSFMKGLCDIDSKEKEINQAIHQMLYAKNLILDLVGSERGEVKFDLSIHLVYPKIKAMSQQTMLETYYEHFDVENFIEFLRVELSKSLKNEMERDDNKPLYRGVQEILNGAACESFKLSEDCFTFEGLTRTGVVNMLKKVNILVEKKNTTNDDVEMVECDENDSTRKRKRAEDSENDLVVTQPVKRIHTSNDPEEK